jgi:MFS family permease
LAARWHFSPLTLTIVFALYAFGLVLALQVTGRLSDHLGRRPVILASIAVEILAMAAFVAAGDTTTLCVARVIQGLATGAATGAISATLIELSEGAAPGLAPMVSSSAPTFGLAFGGIVSSALVQYGPAPLRLIYWVIVAGLLLGALLVAARRPAGGARRGRLLRPRPVARRRGHRRRAVRHAALRAARDAARPAAAGPDRDAGGTRRRTRRRRRRRAAAAGGERASNADLDASNRRMLRT